MLATLAVAIPFALAAPVPAPQAPPPETLSRAQAALDLLDGRGFTGSYRVTGKAHVVASGKHGPEDTLEVEDITIAPDGTRTTRLVRALDDGRDVTAERLAKGDADDTEAAREDSHDSFDVELMPLGANAPLYTFAPPRIRDGVATAEFRPVARGDEAEDLGRGEIAWDAASGEPLWIETGLAERRVGVSALSLRFEFARAGSVLYPATVRTRTKAGIPLLFRLRLSIDLAISDVKPL
jgi:hypothetical protein